MLTQTIIIFTLIAIGEAKLITLCDCNNARTTELMSISTPTYCKQQEIKNPEKEVNYEFYLNQAPHATWTGYACWAWIHESKVEGSFFYAFDTTERTAIEPVSEAECWNMAETMNCGGNKMETKGDISTFNQIPVAEKKWFSTRIKTSKQCQVHKITLTKDCPNCPIDSMLGTLTNATNIFTQQIHQARIVWRLPTKFTEPQCTLREIQTGRGVITEEDETTMKLTDEINQLDYIYNKEPALICQTNVHKLATIDKGYVRIEQDPIRIVTFKSRSSMLCLTADKKGTLQAENCNPDKERQQFRINDRGEIAIGERFFYKKKNESQFTSLNLNSSRKPVRFNATALTLSALEECIYSRLKNESIKIEACKYQATDAQKWEMKTAVRNNIDKTKEDDDREILLLQHHQFIEDKSVERDNAISNEIKEIYCSNMAIRRYLTSMLANQNGLRAARSLNLGECQRVKPIGEMLLIQQCETREMEIEARTTKCGIEPYVNGSKTVGADGYSMIPFQECLWPNNMANLNGKVYTHNGTDWIEKRPTLQIGTLRLIEKFKDIKDRESTLIPEHHPSFNQREIEQINLMNEMASKMLQTNSDSLSSIIVNDQAMAHGLDLTSWISTIASGATGILTIAAVAGIVCVIVRCGLCSKCKWPKRRRSPRTSIVRTGHSHRIPTLDADGTIRYEDTCFINPPSRRQEDNIPLVP